MAVMVALLEAGVMVECERQQKRLRSLYWWLRAEIRRQVGGSRARRQRASFHYDPFSYALNFDEGSSGFLCLTPGGPNGSTMAT